MKIKSSIIQTIFFFITQKNRDNRGFISLSALSLVFFKLFPGIILSICSLSDLMSRKVKNYLIISLFIISLIFILIKGGPYLVLASLLNLIFAFLLCFPLFHFRILGAGDVKVLLLLAFILSEFVSFFWILIYSFFIGSILGLIYIFFKKDFKSLFSNLKNLISYPLFFGKTKKISQKNLNKIPFTVAILIAWITYYQFGAFI